MNVIDITPYLRPNPSAYKEPLKHAIYNYTYNQVEAMNARSKDGRYNLVMPRKYIDEFKRYVKLGVTPIVAKEDTNAQK